MPLDLARHPCFNDKARHSFARIHLPVAPKCNIQCHYCNRSFDCANESRPGVTSAVLSPGQALKYLEAAVEKEPRIAVVGIAGPGDPFANAEETMETLELVRERFPDMLLCVASNGLNVAPYVERLAALEVSHVTITINAVDPDIGAQIYAWVRDGNRVYRGREGAALLLERQLEAVRMLCQHGVTVKINSILVPGINEQEIPRVAETMADLGATIFNCVPLYPVAGTRFAEINTPSGEQVAAIRAECGKHISLMHHCTRCRADAVGILGQAAQPELVNLLKEASRLPLKPQERRPYVAVASHEGMLVNQHLGEAERLLIYAQENGSFHLVETRTTPDRGGGDARWRQLAAMLGDCQALLTASLGDTPRRALTAAGVRCVMMEGLIDEGLDAIFRGKEIRAPLRKQHRCGAGCAGDGTGCA
ncbi:MAG: nitrogenase cofactor biosynthesis protein NifB [Planctomycetota bacterium]